MSICSDSATAWPIAQSPVPSSDTSTIVASPVRSRWKSAPMIPPAIVIAPMESPKPGAGGLTHEVVLGAGGADGHAGAGPERERVVGALVGVGPARALAVPADVDDLLVVRADVVDLDVQLLQHARELVGEEHVGRRDELVQDREAVGRREVEAEALLAAVGVLEQRVHVVAHVGDDAGGREAAHGVAPFDVLDLDDLRTPVGEERRRRRHEGVLGDLEDADALHDVGHDCTS